MALDGEDLAPLLLALLVAVAVGLAAASVDSPVDLGGGSGGVGGETGDAIGGEADDIRGSGLPNFDEWGGQAAEICFPVLQELPALVGLAILLAGIFAFVYVDTGQLFPAAVVLGAIGLPIVFFYTLLATCGTAPLDRALTFPVEFGGANETVIGGGDGGSVGGGGERPSTPTFVVSMLLVLGVLASTVLLFAATRVDDEDELPDDSADSPDDPRPDRRLDDLAAAAGTAADRIESADGDATENEIYRAWDRFATLLSVPEPASRTPSEFADAAVEAGMDPDRVAEITDLFEAVRYGTADPTAERERRAVDALRAIESAHEEEGANEFTDDRLVSQEGSNP